MQSEQIYDSYVFRRLYIPVSDGTRLGASLLIPAKNGKQENVPLPVILHYTPYSFVKMNEKGEMYFSDNLEAMELVKYGYVLSEVEIRGTGISFGTRQVVNSRQEAIDGAEVVEWLASQTFCNGMVGTIGWSYHGQSQLGILSQKPPHLKACVIGMTDFNRYDGWVRNGIPRAFGSRPDTLWKDDPKEREKQISQMALEECPVPEDLSRECIKKAIKEHIGNGEQIPIQQNMNWRDSFDENYGGTVWHNLSASTYKKDIETSEVPLYLLGGIYDVFRQDTILMYHNLDNAKKMMFGPWYHVGKKKNPSPWREILRWMDYWLKGIENDIMEEDPISIYVGYYDFTEKSYDGENSGAWRTEKQWPVTDGKKTCFYLHKGTRVGAAPIENGTLNENPGEEAWMEYQAVYGISTSVESKFTEEEDGRGADQLGLTFSTEPFSKDCSFIGHPMAEISFVLMNKGDMNPDADLDFFITVSDYDPETGLSFQFDDGHLRASLRAVSDHCPYDFLGIPWHENREGSNEYLQEGNQYHLEIDLMPIAYTIRKGHCLRISLENSQDRMYYAGRKQYEANPSYCPPTYRICLGGEQGCRIIMPNIYYSIS